MNLSSTIHYSRSFSGNIWRIKLDEVTNKLWFEIRDDASFEVNLFCVDLDTTEDGQFSVSEPLGWWDSLVHVHSNVLCIQHIKDTNNPGPADLKLVDAESATDLGLFEDLIIEEIKGNFLSVLKGAESHEIQLTEIEEDADFVSQIKWPEVYPEGHEYHATVKSYLTKSREVDIVGPILYKEDQGIQIAFHTKGKEGLNQYLVWIQNEQVILEEQIDQKMSGYSNESFFTFGNCLIFIENRRTVKVHLIDNV